MSILKHPPGRRQSITLLTIDERGSKIARNSVFDCHLSPVNRATNGNRKPCFLRFLYSFVDSIDVFDCRLPYVLTVVIEKALPKRHNRQVAIRRLDRLLPDRTRLRHLK